MIVNDPIGDMLTRIRNAQERRRPKVVTPASNLRAHVLDVLTAEGYIRGYTRVEPKGGHPSLRSNLSISTASRRSKTFSGSQSPDAGSMRRSRNWRLSPTAWASQLFRRRKVSCRTAALAKRTWAAKSSVTYSKVRPAFELET